MKRNIIKINCNPTLTIIGRRAKKGLKVAAYARVSTKIEEQLHSLNEQRDFYTNFIHSQSEWVFSGLYVDEGISGTTTQKRMGFQNLITDALSGKIDLILTKSISRFARNTVDTLNYIRKLKEHGVEVYFEKEDIWTFDPKGEFILTMMSSFAQEEARSISENITWGVRKRYAEGMYSVPFSRFLGYDRGKDGEFVINKNQADIVKLIYKLYLYGKGVSYIANHLTKLQIPTITGKSNRWNHSVITNIIKNEKYKGDALTQKVYTISYITKKKAKNDGVLPQYYISEAHEPIIPPRTFDLVQEFYKQSALIPHSRQGNYSYSGKIFCSYCGNLFVTKYSHNYQRHWKCINHEKGMCPQSPCINHTFLSEISVIIIKYLLNKNASVNEFLQKNHITENSMNIDFSTLTSYNDIFAAIINKVIVSRNSLFFQFIDNSSHEIFIEKGKKLWKIKENDDE